MSELKTIIDANIKENGNQEITGKTLNYVLNKIAEGTEKDWNESDATKGGYIKGRTHGVTYELVSVEGTLKELGYVPGEYVSVLHYARVNGVLEGKGLYLGGLLYNPIVGEEYEVKYAGPSVYAKVVEVEDGYDVQIKGASDTGNILKVAIVDYKTIDDAYISTDIARKSQVDALEQKLNNLPQGEEFDKQGNYPLLHVGTADDLAGRGESVPAEFGFRASGGKSIKDGRAYIKSIKGNSVVWNQILKKREGTWTINGITIISNSDGSFTLNGTATADAWIAFTSTDTIDIVSGHKWFYTGCPSGGSESTYCLWDGSGRMQDVGNGGIAVINDTFISPRILVRKDYTCTNLVFTPRLTDLTKAFPNDWQYINTIEEFNARVATLGIDMNAYNEGEVIHCNTESIKSVGDNAWDEEWEEGILVNGNNYFLEDRIRSKNYIKVIGGEEYCYNNSRGNINDYIVVFYYDENKNYLNKFNAAPSEKFTLPLSAHYIRFYTNLSYGGTYTNDIMLTLVHSGWKQDTDAGYQPYWQDTLPLPIIRKYFPDGMMKAGSAHDEIRYNKASGKWEYSKGKIKSVDMGTMSWSYQDSGYFLFELPELVKDLQYGNNIMTIYATHNGEKIPTALPDKSIMLYNGAAYPLLGIKDSAYTDAASFKAAMAGVMLYYESNDWEWVELDAEDQNFRDYYNVADFGTEQSQSSVPSAPFSADIIYQFNAVDMIREHELEITELQSIIATMQAQLTSLTNGVG